MIFCSGDDLKMMNGFQIWLTVLTELVHLLGKYLNRSNSWLACDDDDSSGFSGFNGKTFWLDDLIVIR